MRGASVVITLVLFLSAPCLAQPAPPPAAAAPVAQSSVGLAIEVLAQPRQVELPGTFKIAFKVQNATPGAIVLREFEVQSVEATTKLEVGKSCSSDTKPIGIAPKEYRTIICDIATPEHTDSFLGFFIPMLGRWSLLTLSPGDYQFVATGAARGENSAGEPIAFTASKPVSVKLVPSVWQSVFGAMLGSLLMVIFWLSSPRVRTHLGIESPGRDSIVNIAKEAGKALALWCGSTAAAAIAIFLTFRLKDASLPFTVSINDFYGGLVIGLFGVVLTKWLGPKLFGPTPAPQKE